MTTTLMKQLFNYVLLATSKYNIDESHGITHSMNVLNYAQKIYQSEVPKKKYLKSQENVIYTCAILHDMCDKKYLNEKEGLQQIDEYLKQTNEMNKIDINVSKLIMSTMSYSTVKKYGYPNLGSYQTAYHIVREADLLTAYDFDRCLIYKMKNNSYTIYDAFDDAFDLFKTRVFKHNDDNLFIHDYAIRESVVLHGQALKRIDTWRTILKI